MLLKDVRDLLYKDVDSDNGPSPVIDTSTDNVVSNGPHCHPNGATRGVERDSRQRALHRTDANGHVTRFDYDGWTDPRRIAFADGTCFEFQYTDSGILEKFLSDQTLLANYKVDPDSGRWRVDYTDGTHAEFVVQNGRITHAVNPSGTVELKYDDNGLLLSETFEGCTVTYHRNETGHLVGLTTPFGQIIHYRRDRLNRVCCIKAWSGQDIRFDYATNGAMESISYPNGTCMYQQSNKEGRPVVLRLEATGADETIFHKIYHRDHLSRITRISSGNNEIFYTYDPEGRLTGAEQKRPSGDSVFTVDDNSNRLSDHHRHYNINSADRLVQAGEIEFQYDHLGNLLQGTCPRGHAQYNYFSLNRLGSFSMDGGRTQYRYDALGRRVAKKVNGVTTRYFWAGNQLLHEVQRRSTGKRKSTGVTDYLFFPGRPALLAIRQDQQTHWAAFGHRYEVLCLTSDNGRPVWQAEYDSFGDAHIEMGAKVFQPFRLAGQYRDDESGLHYYPNRYYDPTQGRHLSMTPLFFESGNGNFYIHGNGDPINWVDCGEKLQFTPMLLGDAMTSSIAGPTHVGQKQPTEIGMNSFSIVKAALLGGVMNTVFSRLGFGDEIAPEETAVEDTSVSTISGLVASAQLPGKSDSAKQLRQQKAGADNLINPIDENRTALPDKISNITKGRGPSGEPATQSTPKPRRPKTIKMPTKSISDITPKPKTIKVSASEPLELMACRRNDDSNKFLESGHVNALTGEVTVNRTDFFLAGRIPISWSCLYQSRNTYAGLLGRGWQTPADSRLEIDNKGSVLFFDGGPTAVLFEALPTDTPIKVVRNGALLTATQEHYQVRLKSGMTYHFAKKLSEPLTHVVRITDAHENFLSFYREDTTLTQIWDNNDQHIHITYRDGRIRSMRLQDNPLVEYRYDGLQLTAAVDALGHSNSYFYSDGAMIRHMDKNKHSYYFKYAKSGQCIRTWDDSGLYEYQFAYPPQERGTVVTDSIGNRRIYVYDQHLSTLIEEDHTGATLTHRYDEMARIISSTDELDRCTAYQYDEAGNTTSVQRGDTQLIALTYDEDLQPIKLIDANGNTWEQQFDDYGQLTKEINPQGKCIKYTYDRHGDLVAAFEDGLWTKFEYDEHGLVSTVIRGENSPTTYQRDANGNTTAMIDLTGLATRYIYDDKNRLIQAQQPSGISQSFDWDPEDNLLIHTDPNGRQTRFEYGVGNRIVRRHNPDDTSVSYQYDTEGNLIGIVNERGQCHHSKYDPAGRITAQTDYFGQDRRFGYDTAGQLIKRVDPIGKEISYTYDSLGRLKTKNFDGEEQALFNWDGIGNLISFQSPGISVERCYNATNQLTTEKNGAFSVDYQYDRNGRPSQRATSHGNHVRYSYDAMGALTAMRINDQPPITIERNERGQITAEHFSVFMHRSFSYDQDGLLTRQTISGTAGEIERRYSYDGAANLIAKQDSHKGDWRFSYDAMDRITETIDPQLQTHRLTYDPCGDLVNHIPTVKEGLRCTRYNDTRYNYNAAGNLVQRNDGEVEYSFEWDESNRLITISNGNQLNITMVYDALGRRHEKSVNGKRSFFNWEGFSLISEQGETGLIREYIYYPGSLSPVAVITGDKKVYYYHNDINGLPLELTLPNGEIVWSADYDALGRLEKLHVNKVSQPLRLPGQYFDEEIGLCYDTGRYFDPVTCAYISQYPLGPTDGENPYTYAPNVWAPVESVGFCKTLLKKAHRQKRHGDIQNACMLNVPMPSPKFQKICSSEGIFPSIYQTRSPITRIHPAKPPQDDFDITITSCLY